MKNYAKIINEEWNKPVREAQLRNGVEYPVEINQVPKVINRFAAQRIYSLLHEEIEELFNAITRVNSDEGKIVEIADAIGDIMYLALGLAGQMGLQDKIEGILDEIHSSNQTKLIDGKITFNDIGKVMKPEGYRKPDLHKVIFK